MMGYAILREDGGKWRIWGNYENLADAIGEFTGLIGEGETRIVSAVEASVLEGVFCGKARPLVSWGVDGSPCHRAAKAAQILMGITVAPGVRYNLEELVNFAFRGQARGITSAWSAGMAALAINQAWFDDSYPLYDVMKWVLNYAKTSVERGLHQNRLCQEAFVATQKQPYLMINQRLLDLSEKMFAVARQIERIPNVVRDDGGAI